MLKFDGSLNWKERFTAWFLFFKNESIAKKIFWGILLVIFWLYLTRNDTFLFGFFLFCFLLLLSPLWWGFLIICVYLTKKVPGETTIVELKETSILISVMNKTECHCTIYRDQIASFDEIKNNLYIRTEDKFGFYINLKRLTEHDRAILHDYGQLNHV